MLSRLLRAMRKDGLLRRVFRLFAILLVMTVPAPATADAAMASVAAGGVMRLLEIVVPVGMYHDQAFGARFENDPPQPPSGTPRNRIAALSLFLADPLTVPLAGAGGVILAIVIAGRRRQRRLLAWGYVPPETLRRRLLALLH